MSTANSAPAPPRATVSYWAVVGSQLAKNHIAMGAGRTALALFVIAVGAPLVAMNIPLVAWIGGRLETPLLADLFDRFVYASGVDVFFNLLLVVGAIWLVAARVPAVLDRRARGERIVTWFAPFRRADVLAVAAGLGLLLSAKLMEPGGMATDVVRGVCWTFLLPSLPWTGSVARLAAGAFILAAGPAFVGWILLALAFPTLTAVLVTLYLALGVGASAGWNLLGLSLLLTAVLAALLAAYLVGLWRFGRRTTPAVTLLAGAAGWAGFVGFYAVFCLLLGGFSTLGWMLVLFGIPGAGLSVYAARRPDEAAGDLRRSRRQRIARMGVAVLFVTAFVLLMGPWRSTQTVVDWRRRMDAASATAPERLALARSIRQRIETSRPTPAQAAELTTDLAFAEGRAAATMPPIPFHPNNVGETGMAPIQRSLDKPNGENALGCDMNGRDVAARLLYGARISLTIGLVAVSIYVTIGVFLGSLAGYYGGWVDIVISRLIEIMLCFPVLFLLLTIVAVFETRSIFLIMAGIGIVGWPGVSRLVRGEFLRQRGLDYVTAAQAQGLPQRRVIFGHVLPNCLGPVLVAATFGIAAAILVESALAFLGLGDTTAPSWGQILTNGRDQGQWHMILAPGFAIFFVVTVFNLLGEGLRDALDPKLRR